MALLEKAAGQGHVYAMNALGSIHREWEEHEQAVEWFTKGAEAGLPRAMFMLGCCLDEGKGVAAPDYPAAADWYRRAAEAGDENGANNLSNMYTVGRGIHSAFLSHHFACHLSSSATDLADFGRARQI
jgi:TPR repeat protein